MLLKYNVLLTSAPRVVDIYTKLKMIKLNKRIVVTIHDIYYVIIFIDGKARYMMCTYNTYRYKVIGRCNNSVRLEQSYKLPSKKLVTNQVFIGYHKIDKDLYLFNSSIAYAIIHKFTLEDVDFYLDFGRFVYSPVPMLIGNAIDRRTEHLNQLNSIQN